MRFSYIIICQS